MSTKKPLKALEKFVKESHDNRELKRALAVKMFIQGCTLRDIGSYLGVSFQFAAKWKSNYLTQGIQSLKVGYQGSAGYLTKKERKEIVTWLKRQPCCTVKQLQTYMLNRYGKSYRSPQSYHQLFKEAHFSFKKSQKFNPKRKAQSIAAKRCALKKGVVSASL